MNKSNLELTEALSAPLGEVISSVAKGVAEAQQAMDLHTIETFQQVYKGDKGMLEQLRQLGYRPTWYKIPEVSAEIQMSLSINATSIETGSFNGQNINRANKFELLAAPVDANYANRFNYDINGSSKLTFKIVPVPPSPLAEEVKVSPFLINKTIGEAIDLLNLLEIPHQFADESVNLETVDRNSTISVVEPSAGSILAKGAAVTLTLN